VAATGANSKKAIAKPQVTSAAWKLSKRKPGCAGKIC